MIVIIISLNWNHVIPHGKKQNVQTQALPNESNFIALSFNSLYYNEKLLKL
jgi:hypothetical protein